MRIRSTHLSSRLAFRILALSGVMAGISVSRGQEKIPVRITSMGASISSGTSSLGTAKDGTDVTFYNGGGYRTKWYQDLLDDGRFTPSFVGSDNHLQEVKPNAPNPLTAAAQTQAEGHPGWRTSQILYNLNHNDGSPGANGGFWLAPGNGRNPDYVALNVGGNDLAVNRNDTQAIHRYDAIFSELNTLRPGIVTMASNMMFRHDAGEALDRLFNPFVPEAVYNHVLAGENVRFVDLYGLFSPGDSMARLSSDGVHPTQAGYDLMADTWYQSMVYGAAWWTGKQDTTWNTVKGTSTNWAMNRERTLDRRKSLDDPAATTATRADVFFNDNDAPLATTLGADTTIRSLNFGKGATGPVSIGGPDTLTIGGGGITVQQGTGGHTITARVALAADQTWGNISSHPLIVSGAIGGPGNLTITNTCTVYTAGAGGMPAGSTVAVDAIRRTGTGGIVLSGKNTYTGTTTVSSGLLVVNGSSIPDGGKLVLNDGAKLEITDKADETVGSLFIGGKEQPAGTYGSSASKASHQDDSHFSGAGILTVGTATASSRRPNIIFVLTDDQRWDALGIMGNPIIRTPNLDRLAGQGVLFKNAYVTTSICCVSRASLLSGQYESRHKINDFATNFSEAALSQTYPALLKNAGYHVGFVGKLGVGNKPPQIFDTMKVGQEDRYFLPDGPGRTIHHTDLVTRLADTYLDAYAKQKEPFYLSIGFKAPHELDGDPPKYPVQERFAHLYDEVTIPYPETADPKDWNSFPDFFRTERNLARKRWLGLFSTPELFQNNVKNYYRLISGVDEAVGHLMEKLKALGVEDNTVIVFMGDNGFFLGAHGMEGKWFGQEESIRVPLFIYDPRSKAPGKTTDTMALNIDIAPTILHFAGLEAPASMQGCNLLDAVDGRREARKSFFYEHTYLGGAELPKVEGVVMPDLKYMKYIEHGYEQLYDLKRDPHETTNLATDPAHLGQLEDMRARYAEMKEAVK